MRFVLNATALRFGGGLTIGREVVRRLSAVAPKHDFLVLVSPKFGYEQFGGKRVSVVGVEWPRMNAIQRLMWLNRDLPKICSDFGANALFSMGNMPSYCAKLPQVVLFHKAHYLYPEVVASLGLRLKDRLLLTLEASYIRHSIRKSIVTVQTDVIRERLVERFRFSRERVVTIPSASDRSNLKRGDGGEYVNRVRSAGKRLKLIYLTRYYPHKNIEVLLDVAELLKKRRIDDVVIFLTLEPDQAEGARRVLEAIDARRLNDIIVNLGSIPREHVYSVLAECDALIMPTLMETFGLPYVEALEAGCSILTSDRDFARAVCGDDAEYFDPTDPKDILAKILSLKQRVQSSIEQQREKTFDVRSVVSTSWDEVTKRYLNLLERVAMSRM